KRFENLKKQVKSGDKKIAEQLTVVDRLQSHLSDGGSARNFTVTEDEKLAFNDLFLLSDKPVLYACNVAEDDVNTGNAYVEQVKEIAEEHEDQVVMFCAKIEAEIAELDDDEKEMFLDELGVESSGLDRLIRAAYEKLGLITYF